MIQILLFIILIVDLSHGLSWTGKVEQMDKWKGKVSKIDNPDLFSIIEDPIDSKAKAIKIKHPKGSCSSFCKIDNGASFDVHPFDGWEGDEATFEYKVFFHSKFDFVKGGKVNRFTLLLSNIL